MAKHRTKEQKLKAAGHHRLQAETRNTAQVELVDRSPKNLLQASTKIGLQWSGSQKTSLTSATSVTPAATAKTQLFFGFDPKWVYHDLRKTLLVSCLIVGILVFIYFLSF